MQILDLLTPNRVVINARISSKKKLLEQLSSLLDSRASAESEREVFDSLCKREKLGSTGLSHGVAIPHGRSSAVQHATGAFLRLAEPIDFNAIDGKPVDLVFALMVPEHYTDQHLMFLAQLAEMFSDDETCQQLRNLQEPNEIFELLTQWHERHSNL